VANAVGTVLGCLVLIILMEERGMDFIKESFPATWMLTESEDICVENGIISYNSKV